MEVNEQESTDEDIFYDCINERNENDGKNLKNITVSDEVNVVGSDCSKKDENTSPALHKENGVFLDNVKNSDNGTTKPTSEKASTDAEHHDKDSETGSEQKATGFIAKDALKETEEYDSASGISNLNLKSVEQPQVKENEDVTEACGGSDSDDESSGDEITLTEEQIEERKIESKKLKDEGNELYKKGEFNEAERLYTEGLKICPKFLQKERSVMYSNRAACLLKMDKAESAIEDCTKAIELYPTYLKAILRRAQLYEKLEKFEEALKDYEEVLNIDPSIHTARAACLRMPGEIEKRNEKLKAQMMSSLKDLGNMFLRPFGLSTNNFQMQQDPATGSYNVQFNNSPSGGDNSRPSNGPSS